jgi:ethanolamine utilization protein EutN
LILAKVIGTVWATRKEEKMRGYKLLVAQWLDVRKRPKDEYTVAADLVDAGIGDTVLIVRGSSARQTKETVKKPCDAIIVGVVDRIDIEQQYEMTKSE